MKFLTSVLLIIVVSMVLQLFMPWWIIALVAAIIGLLINQNGIAAFLAGFLGISLLWLAYAAGINIQNGAILSSRVAELFQIGSHWMLVLITALIGGLVAGFAALTGNSVRKLFN